MNYYIKIFLNKEILEYANKYSEITKEELTNPKYIIEDTLNFIKTNHKKYEMHIASGADENDLRYICEKLDLTKYFLSISGSPKIKSEIVKDIVLDNSYEINETILIGDSVNDFDSAKHQRLARLAEVRRHGPRRLRVASYPVGADRPGGRRRTVQPDADRTRGRPGQLAALVPGGPNLRLRRRPGPRPGGDAPRRGVGAPVTRLLIVHHTPSPHCQGCWRR